MPCVTPCAGVWIEITLPGGLFAALAVTPCAGVWIEIWLYFNVQKRDLSLPVRECGLKYGRILNHGLVNHVTPCAGVWIEIRRERIVLYLDYVTPCAGVWIEISCTPCCTVSRHASLPVRECGLKST